MGSEPLNEKKSRALEKAKRVAELEPTPVLVMDTETLRQEYERFRSCFPDSAIYYALKANSDAGVARLFHKLGAGFEVGSEGALRLLLELGVAPSTIISGNPLKTPAFLELAHSVGIHTFTFDSHSEVKKMATLAPGSDVYVRLTVANNYSEWPLDKKFGVEIEEAAGLLSRAHENGLRPVGVAFHVGSQCISTAGWTEALERSKQVWTLAVSRGLELRSLNLGGGFPSEYTHPVPSVAEISQVVNEGVQQHFPGGVHTLLEPGRALVGEAGVLVTTVIARASRNGQDWVYLDAGVFNGLMESLGGIRYPLHVLREGKRAKYVLAGPSCDSMDALPGEVDLPELEIGDRVYVMTAGAYTTAYASCFDGIPVPRVILA
ncbi:MAG: type III PLP-dependent enzyme [Chloroflexota bacterium]